MLLKVVTLFLIAMAVLAMFGRLRLPGKGDGRFALGRAKTGKCPACGRHRIGSGPCPCGKA
ncbi:hypothetical protein [Rhodovulum strictum]|uniref:hypothetical protein n=1 Tax=Rhodovulum strictum TaxID=58314 RepID=UPI001478C50F|nr:hypothetical protein [Rhodovulum strictum]